VREALRLEGGEESFRAKGLIHLSEVFIRILPGGGLKEEEDNR
jgi:hypothetical protein